MVDFNTLKRSKALAKHESQPAAGTLTALPEHSNRQSRDVSQEDHPCHAV